jgi:hypothetical protein
LGLFVNCSVIYLQSVSVYTLQLFFNPNPRGASHKSKTFLQMQNIMFSCALTVVSFKFNLYPPIKRTTWFFFISNTKWSNFLVSTTFLYIVWDTLKNVLHRIFFLFRCTVIGLT